MFKVNKVVVFFTVLHERGTKEINYANLLELRKLVHKINAKVSHVTVPNRFPNMVLIGTSDQCFELLGH